MRLPSAFGFVSLTGFGSCHACTDRPSQCAEQLLLRGDGLPTEGLQAGLRLLQPGPVPLGERHRPPLERRRGCGRIPDQPVQEGDRARPHEAEQVTCLGRGKCHQATGGRGEVSRHTGLWDFLAPTVSAQERGNGIKLYSNSLYRRGEDAIRQGNGVATLHTPFSVSISAAALG